MPIDRPGAVITKEVAVPDYLQILSGCLLLGFFLCLPMIVYTNYVKGAAATLAAGPDRQASTTEVTLAQPLPTPEAIKQETTAAPRQIADALMNGSKNRSTRTAPVRKSTLHQEGAASQRPRITERALPKLFRISLARAPRVHPSPGRTWSRGDSPRRVKAALIIIGRQSFKTTSKREN